MKKILKIVLVYMIGFLFILSLALSSSKYDREHSLTNNYMEDTYVFNN